MLSVVTDNFTNPSVKFTCPFLGKPWHRLVGFPLYNMGRFCKSSSDICSKYTYICTVCLTLLICSFSEGVIVCSISSFCVPSSSPCTKEAIMASTRSCFSRIRLSRDFKNVKFLANWHLMDRYELYIICCILCILPYVSWCWWVNTQISTDWPHNSW